MATAVEAATPAEVEPSLESGGTGAGTATATAEELAAELAKCRAALAEATKREAEVRKAYERLDSAFRAQLALAQQTRDEVVAVARRTGEEAEARVRRRDQKIAQLEQRQAAAGSNLKEARDRADAAEQRCKEAQAEMVRIRESSSTYVASIANAIAEQARRYDECTRVLLSCSASLTSSSLPPHSASSPSPPPAATATSSATNAVVAVVVEAERRLMALMEATTALGHATKVAQGDARARGEEIAALRQQLGLQQQLLEEVRQLRARYFFSIALNIKQNLLSSSLSPAVAKAIAAAVHSQSQQHTRHWRDIQDLFEEATTAQIAIADWPRWISAHIEDSQTSR